MMTAAAPPTQQQQWLVSFQAKTLVVHTSHSHDILNLISKLTKWPISLLQITSQHYPHVSIRTKSRLLGGKGGFGTLLKSQGRGSGVKQTTDFGACRDLQGRRLRHVNDEIKLRKWREAQQKIKDGEQDPNDTDYMMKTASGIYGWHLMTPAWSDLSKKSTTTMQRNLKRQFERFQSEADKVLAAKKAKEDEYHQSVDAYVRQSNQASETLNVSGALQQGLAAKRKREEEEANNITDDEEGAQPNSLITLSGDLVVEESNDGWKVQSQTEFGTMALVLEGDAASSLYYEVQLVTAGLAQVGWAHLSSFRPSTETGDGVGDDAASYAIDASRRLVFHDGKEVSYDSVPAAKPGDVLGCTYTRTTKKLSFALNGKDLGVSFTLDETLPLVPALSCNQGEILDLKLKKEQLKYPPKKGTVPVYELMEEAQDVNIRTVKPSNKDDGLKPAASKKTKAPAVIPDDDVQLPTKKSRSTPNSAPSDDGPLDLSKFKSVDELVALGIDRLKSALLAIQCKCGGTLEERAKRLYSLKGLDRKDYPPKVRARNFVE